MRAAARTEAVCRCGAAILAEDGRETRIRHNVPCFVFGHCYMRVGERHGHREYACVECGHPLLFRVESDPYAQQSAFRKRVRYFCNLFGHQVHRVAERGDFTEYACACGHSFLKALRNLTTITHPLVCLVAGHFVRFVERRSGFAEFLCRNCGHTFCLAVR
jgi:CDGSH-type Zn-finger protein